MELLVTVIFMSVAVSSILTLITASQMRANSARQRMIALGLAQNELENLKVNARKANVVAKTVTTSVSPAGATFPMSVKTIISRAALPNLYDCQVIVTYDDKGSVISLATRSKS